MFEQLLVRQSRADLDDLVTALDVEFLGLAECLVSPGWRLELGGGPPMPAIHYCLTGSGLLRTAGQEPMAVKPHTLMVMPKGLLFQIEATGGDAAAGPDTTLRGRDQVFPPGAIRRYEVGRGPYQMILICGYFCARYGANVELFSDLMTPIVEQFDESHHLDVRLKTALAELITEEVGAGAMSNALLKQVLVTLLRRSLSSMNLWVERFAVLSDPQIARAFADMVARPSAPHSLKTLAQTAGLSRTLFAERFARLFGKAPMATLRDLRMRQAVALLNSGEMSMDQLAEDCGYSARTSFLRAFQAVHGTTPSAYLRRLRSPSAA
ncbi:AraC family transcriptional regulator [Bradyrhizobium sp. C9]|uniref:helix-turn-helix domain-containing protein n=1 Tax=Bradyrhizobium sp. C9 TaxID=142585 RepID=UPI000BE9187F|nr:AraC family transcriptional regulator [Bradyrhizobium sp. C9]PDT73439.1 AraC family transcriptional regulator [Bradyrhizobium sp. C9]